MSKDRPYNHSGLPSDLLDSERIGLRLLKVTDEGQARTSFGESTTAQLTPLVQVTAQYGILEDVTTVVIGGSATTEDSKFVASTGTSPSGIAAILSEREAQYKAGQGLLCRLTALFTEGVPNSTQFAGFITSESTLAFGFDGDEFGIVHAKDGNLEIQELEITTAAGGSETATVTIDGNDYNVDLTAGTAAHNASQIATQLDGTVPAYILRSNGDKVVIAAQLPELGDGAFSFSSPTAVGAFTQIQEGVIPTETWVKKEDWNVNPNMAIDPMKGNVYQVQLQYLGFGGIRFGVENPDTARIETVHIIKYANSSTVPSVGNPIFRLGWGARNTGNTTNVVIQGASGSIFNEGTVIFDGRPKGVSHTQIDVGTTRTNVLSVRNRICFNSTFNRAEVIPVLATLATDTTKTAVFEIVQNPIIAAGSELIWGYVDEDLSLLETATDSVEIVGGDVVSVLNIKSSSSEVLDISKIIDGINPGISYAITAKISSPGAASDMDASFTWKEDL